MRNCHALAARLAPATIALMAIIAVTAAAAQPVLPRANRVWEWHDLTAAWAALVLGVFCALGAAALAAVQWRTQHRTGPLLAAQTAAAGAACASALVLLRSGAWLSDMRAELIAP